MSTPLLKPRWLLGHVLALVATVSFTALGFWQLDRHYQQREDNAGLETRLAAAPADLTDLRDPPESLELRTAVVSGRYDYAARLELRPRVRNGQQGHEQILPLRTGAGTILVNRGFIADAAGPPLLPLRDVEVVVTGTIRLSQGTSRFGPQNPDTGTLDTIARIDIDRLNPQFEGTLLPVYLDLISEQPQPGGAPTVLPAAPEPTNRPNFLYALQWWALATIASVGWVVFLRKQFFSP